MNITETAKEKIVNYAGVNYSLRSIIRVIQNDELSEDEAFYLLIDFFDKEFI